MCRRELPAHHVQEDPEVCAVYVSPGQPQKGNDFWYLGHTHVKAYIHMQAELADEVGGRCSGRPCGPGSRERFVRVRKATVVFLLGGEPEAL